MRREKGRKKELEEGRRGQCLAGGEYFVGGDAPGMLVRIAFKVAGFGLEEGLTLGGNLAALVPVEAVEDRAVHVGDNPEEEEREKEEEKKK